MIAVLAFLLVRPTAAIGPFQVSEGLGGGVAVQQGSKNVFLDSNPLSCQPEYSKTANRLVIGMGATLACVAPGPRVVWCKPLHTFYESAYLINPGSVIALRDRIVFDMGRFNPNYWKGLTKTQARRGIDKSVRMIAVDYAGKVVWNKPWSVIGSPLVAVTDDVMFCSQSLDLLDEAQRAYTLCLRDKRGRLLKRWLLRNPTLPSGYEGMDDSLSMCLHDCTVWDVKRRGGTTVLTCTEVGDPAGLDLTPVKGGFGCTITIRGDSLRVAVTSPKRLQLVGRPT